MSIYKSIAKNYAASGIGLGITFLNQIAMVPLFIVLWGINQYADWILITAFSSFFTMTDAGLNSVTQNEFVIRYHRKEYDICEKLLVNMFFLVASVGLFFVFIAICISCIWGFKGLLSVSVFSEFQTSYLFMALLLQIFMKMFGSTYNGIYKATSHAARATMIENTIKFCEIVILFVGLWLKIDIVFIITAYVIPTIFSIIFRYFDSRKWFKFNITAQHFDFGLLKSLIKPALAFMALPLGYAISNQGMIFVVSTVLGPILLVAFTTTRTLINFLRAFMNMLASAIWPEISAAYGRKDAKTMESIYHRAFILTFVSSIVCILFLALFGKPIYMTWTRHAIEFNAVFFYGMLVVLIVSCLWGIASVLLSAINKHIEFSIAFLLSVILGVGLTYFGLHLYPNLSVIPLVLFVPEVLLLYFILKKNNQILNNNFDLFRHKLGAESVFLAKKITFKSS